MTLFFISAATLVVICLLWLLLGLFKGNQDSTDQEAVNVTLAKERIHTLEAALADGAIDQASFDYEREQLEYDLASDLKLESEQTSSQRGGHMAAAILVAVFVPIAAGTLYLEIGNPGAITQKAALQQEGATAQNGTAGQITGSDGQTATLAELLPRLEERLAASPEDINGWRLLGRSYLSVSEFEKASQAFAKALALDENDTATIAQLAESIAMTRDGELAGEPMELLQRANKIDPGHEHTLWLLAIGRQQAGDHEGALAGFNQLADIARDNPEALATIEQMRSQSVQALGMDSVDRANANTDTTDRGPAPVVTKSITVNVSLIPEIMESVDPTSAVFVYAKASQGPPMPLAVARIKVSDLPTTITLDDSMAMIPSMSLSSFEDIVVGARVSPSGNPIAQTGDWFDESTSLNTAETSTVDLTIDKQSP